MLNTGQVPHQDAGQGGRSCSLFCSWLPMGEGDVRCCARGDLCVWVHRTLWAVRTCAVAFRCLCVWSGRQGGMSGEASVGLRVCSVARQHRSGASWWAFFILSLWRVTCLPWGVGGGARWVWINCASRVVQEWDKSSRFDQHFPLVVHACNQWWGKGRSRAGVERVKRAPSVAPVWAEQRWLLCP